MIDGKLKTVVKFVSLFEVLKEKDLSYCVYEFFYHNLQWGSLLKINTKNRKS